jgi:neurotransmitter:Na+ symporter, NSS family
MQRESWKSRLGFIFAALGSAVGLGSIWRFPYVVGENGGAAFVFLYLFCLALIGFPVLVSEILIGRSTQKNPSSAFFLLGKSKKWQKAGKLTILTGFLISTFYSVIAGCTLGYLVEAVTGKLHIFRSGVEAFEHFQILSSSSFWLISYHFLFMLICALVLLTGVRKGIETGSKIMMPMLIMVLIIIMIKGLSLPNSMKGIDFLFTPKWNLLTPSAFAMALGQAFFTLSLGQGTMVTYGSYLSQREDIPRSCIPVVLLNTLIGLLAGIAVFAIVFSAGLEPSSGPALIFETLPVVFSQISWGWSLSILFFILVAIAAITSEISALEPAISYLIDEKNYSRKKATTLVAIIAFIIGIPSALSFGIWKSFTIFGSNFYEAISDISINFLVPIGGFLAVILVGWKWGINQAFENLRTGSVSFFKDRPWLAKYFHFCIKYTAPILIIIILLNLLGVY